MKRREPLTNTQLLTTIAIGIFFAMYLAAMVSLKGGFLRFQQIFDLLNDNAYLIIIACALTIVMIGGGINISVGGVIGLTVMACALALNDLQNQSGALGTMEAIGLALGIGLAFGVGQGFLISYLEIQPFIVTLAGMFLSRGVTTMVSSENVPIKHEAFLEMKKVVLQIPGAFKLEIGAAFALLILVGMYLLLRHHRLGRSIYALGGNQQSALMLGINVKRSRFLSYVISSILAALAGYVFIMHASSGKTSIGLRSEMDAIASAIIGGTLLTGGVGNVFGTFFGVMILSTIQEIMAASKVQESYWQEIASGAMLALFILMQSVVLARRGKKITLPSWLKFKKEKTA